MPLALLEQRLRCMLYLVPRDDDVSRVTQAHPALSTCRGQFFFHDKKPGKLSRSGTSESDCGNETLLREFAVSSQQCEPVETSKLSM